MSPKNPNFDNQIAFSMDLTPRSLISSVSNDPSPFFRAHPADNTEVGIKKFQPGECRMPILPFMQHACMLLKREHLSTTAGGETTEEKMNDVLLARGQTVEL